MLVIILTYLVKHLYSAVCSSTTEPYDSEKMAIDFQGQFINQAFTRGQPLAYQFENKKTLILEVKEIEGTLFSGRSYEDKCAIMRYIYFPSYLARLTIT